MQHRLRFIGAKAVHSNSQLSYLFFQYFGLDNGSTLVSEVVSKKIGVETLDSIVNFSVDHLPLLVACILSYRYFQLRALIERQYSYLEALEEELTTLFPSGIPYTRESNFSLRENENLSIWSHKPYNVFFSFIFFFFVVFSWVSGFVRHGFSWLRVVTIIALIAISLYLYFRPQHKKDTNQKRD